MLDRLAMTDGAILSHAGTVRAWECDRNGHWNVQFYVRALQAASEFCALAVGKADLGSGSADRRHYRFHGELFCPTAVNVLSSRVAQGPNAGWVLHRLVSAHDGRLSATALERPLYRVDDLPICTEAALAPARPRGLTGRLGDAAAGTGLPVGPIRPSETDHHGNLLWHEMVGSCAAASHGFLGRIGLTTEWIDRTETNRMAVEMTASVHSQVRAGHMLEVICTIPRVAERFFVTRFDLRRMTDGTAVASVEQLLLMVDLKTRRPVAVPDFISAAARD